MSDKRRKEAREYSAMRKEFLRLRPICEAHSLVTGQKIVHTMATDIHHMEKRGRNYLRKETWLPVCRECHAWCHANPKEAEKLGLLSPNRNRSNNTRRPDTP